MGSIYKRERKNGGHTYYADVSRNGKREQVSLRTSNHEVAKAKLRGDHSHAKLQLPSRDLALGATVERSRDAFDVAHHVCEARRPQAEDRNIFAVRELRDDASDVVDRAAQTSHRSCVTITSGAKAASWCSSTS